MNGVRSIFGMVLTFAAARIRGLLLLAASFCGRRFQCQAPWRAAIFESWRFCLFVRYSFVLSVCIHLRTSKASNPIIDGNNWV